jgi:hypothetical protein
MLETYQLAINFENKGKTNKKPIRVDSNNIHNLMPETIVTTLGLPLGTMNPL